MPLRESEFVSPMTQANGLLTLFVFLALFTAVHTGSAEGDSSVESLYLPKASRFLALVVRDPGNSPVRRRLAAEYEQSKTCRACAEFFLLTARYLEGEKLGFDSTTVFRQQHQTTSLVEPGRKVYVSLSASQEPSPPQEPHPLGTEELAMSLRKELTEDFTAWREVAQRAQLALEKDGWKDCGLLEVLSHAWLYGWIFQNEKFGAEKAELALRIVFENADGRRPCNDRAASALYLLASSFSFQRDPVSAYIASALAVDFARRWESSGNEMPESFIRRVTDFANELEKSARHYRNRSR